MRRNKYGAGSRESLTREPRSVYSLQVVTVRAEDINDATEQRPSITSPSSVLSLFPLYRKYRLST